MTARTSKPKPASKRKRSKPNGTEPAKATAHLNGNGTAPEQPEANGSSAQANGKRKPSVPYTDEIGDIICDKLRDGETLNAICNTSDMPTESTVRLWASEDTPFAAKYARARELGYQEMADDLVTIADEPGDPNRNRLRVDTRKWLLSKALPKIYGDRLEVDAKAGLVVVETPAAIKALLDALPELGVMTALPALALAATASEAAGVVVEASAAPSVGELP